MIELPYLTSDEIEQEAAALLMRAFGTEEPGLPIDLDAILFDYLAEEEQLSYREDQLLEGIGGDEVLGVMRPRLGRIEVSRRVKDEGPTGRYRFTVAHEIAHWVLHRPLLLAAEESLSLFDDVQGHGLESLHRNVFPKRGSRVPREEFQANAFAAFLLMPRRLLRREYERRFGDPPMPVGAPEFSDAKTPREVARRLAEHRTLRNALNLAEAFLVSRQAMSIALQGRGYVTAEELIV